MKMQRRSRSIDEYSDYMEQYDAEFNDAILEEDEIESEGSSESINYEIPSEVEEEMIAEGYKTLGIARVPYSEEDQSIKYDTDPENLKIMFQMYRDGNEKQREIAGFLIEHQLRSLVYSIAHKYFKTYMDNKQEVKELVNSAWCGVFQAAADYDPTRAAPSTYFYRPILHEMSEYVNRFLHKTTSYSMNVLKKVRTATERLIEKGNYTPSVLDLSFESGLRASAIHKALDCEYYSKSRSLEELPIDPVEYNPNGKSAKAREDYDDYRIAITEFSNPLTQLCMQEEENALTHAMNSLTDIQKDVLCRLFGIGYDKAQSHAEIFKETHIPTDKIKKIETQAMARLRHHPELARNFNMGKATEIKRDLDYEPLVITPDNAANMMMSTLDELESIDIF